MATPVIGLVASSKKSIKTQDSRKELKIPLVSKTIKDFKDRNRVTNNIELKENPINNFVSEKIANNSTDENAIEILKIRYAKGEISKDEFRQMKKDIED